jgi:hypothetical protein
MELNEAVKPVLKEMSGPVLFRPLVRFINNKNLKMELDSLCRNGNRPVIDLIPSAKLSA